MAVEAFAKTNLMEDMEDDDDDVPLVFKRSSTTSKQNQSNSSSQKQDGRSGRQVSDVRSPNGQSSSGHKLKTVTSSKASPGYSPLTSPKASPSSSRTSHAPNSKPSSSAGNQAKNVDQQSNVTRESKQAVEPKSEPNDEAEDSDDDKPLRARLPSGLSKSNSIHANKVLGTSTSVHKSRPPKKEDSDDDIPLASRFQTKPNAGASTSKFTNSEEVKPKFRPNGLPSATVLSKRPPGDVKSAPQASVKKPRLSDVSTPVSSKQPFVKTEKKTEDDDDDDEDDVPLSQRPKKAAVASASKVSSIKKATKVVSQSMKKTKKKFKKTKYSKSSKVQPSSGEGQKWTTLEHNGVIFPPPYKPHGVKMLYKGKPVDLTPEQEEVSICLWFHVSHSCLCE